MTGAGHRVLAPVLYQGLEVLQRGLPAEGRCLGPGPGPHLPVVALTRPRSHLVDALSTIRGRGSLWTRVGAGHVWTRVGPPPELWRRIEAVLVLLSLHCL